MNPIEFPQQNCVLAKNQPEYLPLPVHKTQDGIVVSCWRFTWRERLRILIHGTMWLQCYTFNQPLQPLLPTVTSPFIDGK